MSLSPASSGMGSCLEWQTDAMGKRFRLAGASIPALKRRPERGPRSRPPYVRLPSPQDNLVTSFLDWQHHEHPTSDTSHRSSMPFTLRAYPLKQKWTGHIFYHWYTYLGRCCDASCANPLVEAQLDGLQCKQLDQQAPCAPRPSPTRTHTGCCSAPYCIANNE